MSIVGSPTDWADLIDPMVPEIRQPGHRDVGGDAIPSA